MLRATTGGIVVCMALAVEVAVAEPAGVDLAQLAGWDIVVAADASPGEAYAAEEFRSIFAQASGIELPIVTAPDRADRHVLIGPSRLLAGSSAGFDVAARWGPRTLRIVVRDNLIAIAGGRPRGTLYGVYTFLEDYLGVRFLTADHTHVPKLPRAGRGRPARPQLLAAPLVPLELLRRDQSLAHAGRPAAGQHGRRRSEVRRQDRPVAHQPLLRPPNPDGQVRQGASRVLRLARRQAPVGRRGRLVRDRTVPDQPRRAQDRDGGGAGRAEGPPGEGEHLGQPERQRQELPVPRTARRSTTARARRWARCWSSSTPSPTRSPRNTRRSRSGTLSYWYTRKPPKTLKPRPNVQIQLCSIECCMIHPINDPHCEKNVQFCKDMDEWGKLTENIFIWNYNTNFSNYLLPCPNLRVIEPNIRYFVANGAKGIFMQAAGNSTGAELSDLRNYVMANLLWDPSRSGRQLIDEFLDLHYGKAAPPIRRFINMYHDHCESKGIHRNCFGRAADYAIDETDRQGGHGRLRRGAGAGRQRRREVARREGLDLRLSLRDRSGVGGARRQEAAGRRPGSEDAAAGQEALRACARIRSADVLGRNHHRPGETATAGQPGARGTGGVLRWSGRDGVKEGEGSEDGLKACTDGVPCRAEGIDLR